MAGGGLFSVEVDMGEVDQLLKDLEERGENLSPIMSVVAEDLVAAVSDMYESTGHGTWPGLSDATLRRGGGKQAHKPMVDTGRAAASTEPHFGPDYAEATTNVDYLKFHLDGGPVIPKRNPFELPDAVFDEATETILAYVAGE